MWCSTCQQDVPGLSTANGGELRCGKCGTSLGIEYPIESVTRDSTSEQPVAKATRDENATLEKLLSGTSLGNEDWALEAELRGVQRLLGSLRSRAPAAAEAVSLHTPHQSAGSWHATIEHPRTASEMIQPASDQPRNHSVAWAILSLGLASFACGAMLLVWSVAARRDDLWPIGMPLALIGQAGLVLGLVLQLDGLWHSGRKTAAAINELDGELKNVRQATTLLSTSRASGAQSFYLHLAEGASPQLLLADLKGQIDLLAQQLAKQGRS